MCIYIYIYIFIHVMYTCTQYEEYVVVTAQALISAWARRLLRRSDALFPSAFAFQDKSEMKQRSRRTKLSSIKEEDKSRVSFRSLTSACPRPLIRCEGILVGSQPGQKPIAKPMG